MNIITAIVKPIISIFVKQNPGVIFQILAAKAGSVIAAEILNPENQKKAFIFVKELHLRDDLDGKTKAKVFNQMMLLELKKTGKKVTESTLNCLRELAVTAMKCEEASDVEK